MEISRKKALFRRFDGLRDVRYLLSKSRSHLAIAVELGDFHALIQFAERPRNLTLAEKHTNLSKDTGVERSFLGGIHDSKVERRNTRFDFGWIYHSGAAKTRLSLLG